MHKFKINTQVPCQKEFHTFSILTEKSESSCGEEKHHILESCLGRTLVRQESKTFFWLEQVGKFCNILQYIILFKIVLQFSVMSSLGSENLYKNQKHLMFSNWFLRELQGFGIVLFV